ncbi:MAG: hypothetical protein GWO86_02190 [Planctomycetes bacterium]|nr:hypothetical protein [Planctomycetota bacterium]
MSAKAVRGKGMKAPSNVYTTLLAMALGVVCATAALVAVQNYLQYNTLLKIVEAIR